MAALSSSQDKDGVDQVSSSETQPAKDQESSSPSKLGGEPPWNDQTFSEYVNRLRTEMVYLGDDFVYLNHEGKIRWKASNWIPGGEEIWYGETDSTYYVKIVDAPGTLAGDILGWKRDLPRYNCNLEIIGNDVREVEPKECPVYPDVDPDLEDCSEEVAKLPLIAFDPEKHFTKSPTYKQEIRYLLQCQGSPRIVQLLGKTKEGDLVFPKFKRSFDRTAMANKDQGRIQNIRRWMIDIIDGVASLHSLGIVHRDLASRNILESDPLVICDLQCLNDSGFCRAFEIDSPHGPDRSKYSFASDVFALGTLLWQCCFYNAPKTRYVLLENPPPPPFRDIFLACTQVKPEDRPTLAQLRAMYEAIPTNQ